MLKIDDEDKYKIVLNDRPFQFYATRHGEVWQDLVGNNLVLAMYHRIEHLTELLDKEYVVNKYVPIHKIVVSVKPKEKHYEYEGKEPIIKYTCPICAEAGLNHQLVWGDGNCQICGINLNWKDEE